LIIPACETDDHLAAAAGHSVNPGRWLGLFDELMLRIGGEARQLGYVLAVAKSHRWLLVRRNLRTRELAFYRCYSPHHVPLATLVRPAGRRWTIEEDFSRG